MLSMKWSIKLKEALLSKKGRFIIDFTIIVTVSIVIFRNFLFTQEWPAGNDTLGWISRVYIFGKDFRWLQLWRPYSFGFVEGINFMDFFFMVFYLLTRNPATTITIFLFFSFLVAGFAMYVFVYFYTKRHLASLSASLVYLLNQWFFSQFSEGHVDIIFSYAFAPLIFLSLDRALENGKLKNILLLSLSLFLFLAGFHLNCVVIYGFFMSIFLLFYLFYPDNRNKLKLRFRRLVKVISLSGILVFLLASFVILPFVFNVKAYFLTERYRYPIEEAIAFSARNMAEAFTLKATEEGGYIFIVDIKEDFGLPDFPVHIFLLILFFLSYSTILIHRDRYTAFFFTASLISIFISKGSGPPLGDFFVWAWFNIPYFAVFRRPNRWEMMTAFSNAFFVAVLVNILTAYIEKRRKQKEKETCLQVEVFSIGKPEEKFLVSFDLYKLLRKIFDKILYYVSVTLLILILLIGFISCHFFFAQGLVTYTPPETYMRPYKWIALQNGLFKVVTVNRGPAEWWGDPASGSDFGFCRMQTDVGWGHDLGFDSSFIHDKPVLQDGGWEPLSHGFVDHLRLRLVHDSMTDDLLKILGAFNYKFIVIPSYASEKAHHFFLNQEGAVIVYNQNGSLILENPYCVSPAFITTNALTIVGGLETFSSLCKINSFNLSETALLFFNQNTFLNRSDAIVFTDCDQTDMIMNSLRKNSKFILAADYGVSSLNYTEYWAPSSFWRNLGKFVFGENTLTTNGKRKVTIPFSIEEEGRYDIWLRIGYAPDRGKLNVYLDKEQVGEIIPFSNYWSALKWIKIASLSLKNGQHTLVFLNDGSGYNDIDAIVIVNSTLLQSKTEEVKKTLQAFTGRLIYFLESENIFAQNLGTDKNFVLVPYEGLMLSIENTVTNISKEGTATASSYQEDPEDNHEAIRAIDGDLTTRWASSQFESSNPQWLQIEWKTPRELVGVQVFFEYAYAKNYMIQTWDIQHSSWINQSIVTENELLRRLHIFEKSAITNKIRIYATKFTRFNTVSIWEMECYEKSAPLLTKLSLPKGRNYMMALRVNYGPDYGILYLKTSNEKIFEINCFNSEEKVEWKELGPFNVDTNEQIVSIGALGKINLDGLVIYSLGDSENYLSLDSLFGQGKVNSYVLSCEKLNPCTYRVHAKASEPFLLILSESYNPLWKVYINKQEISPITAYSFVNGFYINETGEFYITIHFTGQNFASFGLKLSLTTSLIVLILMLIPTFMLEKVINHLKKFSKKRLKSLSNTLKKIVPIYKKYGS
jgi:hypothetical protein